MPELPPMIATRWPLRLGRGMVFSLHQLRSALSQDNRGSRRNADRHQHEEYPQRQRHITDSVTQREQQGIQDHVSGIKPGEREREASHRKNPVYENGEDDAEDRPDDSVRDPAQLYPEENESGAVTQLQRL